MIKMYRESPEHGHETLNVKNNELKETIVKELDNKKWVTVEKKDGTAKTLTKQDTKEPNWKKMFAKKAEVKSTTTPTPTEVITIDEVKSITSTFAAKGA